MIHAADSKNREERARGAHYYRGTGDGTGETRQAEGGVGVGAGFSPGLILVQRGDGDFRF